MSANSTPQGRFHLISMKTIKKYKTIVDEMNRQGLLNTNEIDPEWIDIVLSLGEKIDDQEMFANNIEIAIEKSMPVWIFAHHLDEAEKERNTEFMRNNLTMFLTGIPEEFSGIPRELDRLAKLKDTNGNYRIGKDFVDAAYRDAEGIVRTMIAYLEQFTQGQPERLLTVPIKNRLVTYRSKTPNHPKFGTVDVGFWRFLFPPKK